MEILDLTHVFNSEIPVYPGDPQPELFPVASIAKDGFLDFGVKSSMHVGTHMDAPAHMLAGGKYLHEFSPERFFCRGVIVDARGKSLASEELLANIKIQTQDAVLVFFGWSEVFGHDEYYQNYPQISESFAKRLALSGVSIFGTDTPSPDRAPYAVHRLLFKSDILIIENLVNLQQLIGKRFELIALPVKFQADSAPCRVVAKILL